MAETWHRVWGDGKLFRGPRFLNDSFSEKNPIFTEKICYDLFKSLTRFLGFSLSFPRFSVSFTMLNVVYDPFLARINNHYFRKEFLYDTFLKSVRTFARIRQHYFSKYWGDGYMCRPPPQIFGGPSPSSSWVSAYE